MAVNLTCITDVSRRSHACVSLLTLSSPLVPYGTSWHPYATRSLFSAINLPYGRTDVCASPRDWDVCLVVVHQHDCIHQYSCTRGKLGHTFAMGVGSVCFERFKFALVEKVYPQKISGFSAVPSCDSRGFPPRKENMISEYSVIMVHTHTHILSLRLHFC